MPRHGLVDCFSDAQTVGLGQLLDPLGQHHTRSRHRAIGNHHLAEGDADAYSRLQVVLEGGVGLSVLYLC